MIIPQTSTPVISDEVLFEYEAIRQSGKANMHERQTVETIASACGFAVLAEIAKTAQTYSRVLMAWREVDEPKYKQWCANLRPTVRDLLEIE